MKGFPKRPCYQEQSSKQESRPLVLRSANTQSLYATPIRHHETSTFLLVSIVKWFVLLVPLVVLMHSSSGCIPPGQWILQIMHHVNPAWSPYLCPWDLERFIHRCYIKHHDLTMDLALTNHHPPSRNCHHHDLHRRTPGRSPGIQFRCSGLARWRRHDHLQQPERKRALANSYNATCLFLSIIKILAITHDIYSIYCVHIIYIYIYIYIHVLQYHLLDTFNQCGPW